MAFLKKYPLPISGLILALLALGNLLKPYSEAARLVFGIAGLVLYLIFIVKLLVFNVKLKEPLNHPVVASVFPAITMATMLVPTYIKPYTPYLVTGLWYVGLVGHGLLEVWFASKFLFKLNIKNVFPSWYIVFCGIAVGSVTSPAVGQMDVGKVAFWIAFVGFIVIMPIVVYRVWKVKEIPTPARPTLIVLSAPASLLLAGYMSAFEVKDMPMVLFLMFFSYLFYIIALCYLPGLLKLKFSPAYSAFTFPLVISAIAGKLTAMFFIKQGVFSQMIWIARFQEVVATLIVVWVLLCYLKFLFTKEEQAAAK